MALSAERFWSLAWADYHALRGVREEAKRGELQLWAIERADFANVHFRQHDEKGRYTDAPFIADDFLGAGNREQRTAELKRSMVMAELENVRLAQLRTGQRLKDFGKTKIKNGKVVHDGVPDVFRQIQEKHEAELAVKGKH